MNLAKINGKGDVPSLMMFLIGNIGMILGAWMLKGDLDHRYPFKIMSVPPANYYVEISNYLAVFAPITTLSASFVAFYWLKVKGSVAGYGSLVICPLIFSLGLWVITATGPYRDQLDLPLNYDASTATQRHWEFFNGAAEVFCMSLIVYGLACVGIKVLFLIAHRRKFLR